MYGIIYCVKNKINGKVYIGQTTKNIEERKMGHYKSANKETPKYYFHKAIKKTGKENFDWLVLAEAETKEKLNYLEIFYIEEYNSMNKEFGYNLQSGGSRGKNCKESIDKIRKANIGNKNCLGYRHTEEAKYKMCRNKIGNKNCLGRKHTEETRKKISEAHKGKKLSVEHIEKIRQANLGRILTDKWKNKISESNKGKKLTEETKQKIREARTKQIFSEESIKKGVEKRKGRIVSQETRRKIGNVHKEKKLSVEHIEKIRAKLIGRKLSKETIEKRTKTLQENKKKEKELGIKKERKPLTEEARVNLKIGQKIRREREKNK